jgi:hypothetical protein
MPELIISRIAFAIEGPAETANKVGSQNWPEQYPISQRKVKSWTRLSRHSLDASRQCEYRAGNCQEFELCMNRLTAKGEIR